MDDFIPVFGKGSLADQLIQHLSVFYFTQADKGRRLPATGCNDHFSYAVGLSVKPSTVPPAHSFGRKFIILFQGIIDSIIQVFRIVKHEGSLLLLFYRLGVTVIDETYQQHNQCYG
jgi:hypothetical protein